MERFSKLASLTAFKPFVNAANALEQINALSESSLTDDLKSFLTMNLPKVGGGPLEGRRRRVAGGWWRERYGCVTWPYAAAEAPAQATC